MNKFKNQNGFRQDDSPAKRIKFASYKEDKPTLPDIPLPKISDAKFDTLTQNQMSHHASPGNHTLPFSLKLTVKNKYSRVVCTSSNWEFIKSIIYLAGFAGHGVLNKDPTFGYLEHIIGTQQGGILLHQIGGSLNPLKLCSNHGVLKNGPTVWPDGARPHPISPIISVINSQFDELGPYVPEHLPSW